MKKFSLVLALAMVLSLMAFTTVSAESSVTVLEDGWNAMFIDNGSAGTATVSAAIVGTDENISTSTQVNGSAVWEGESALKMVMDHTGSSGNFSQYGNYYAYTVLSGLEDGKTYTITGYYLSGDAGDWTTALGLGIPNETDMTYTAKVNNWINGDTMSKSSVSGTYWIKFSFDFTYEAATMEGLAFHAYQRSRGYNYQNELSIDNIQICEKDTDNYILNEGFGTDEVELPEFVLTNWAIDADWNAMFVPGTKGNATVTAEVVTEGNVYNGTTDLGSAILEGASSLKMTYAADAFDYGGYGYLYAYTSPMTLEDGATYDVSFLTKAGDTAYSLAFTLGTVDTTALTVTKAAGERWFHDSDTSKIVKTGTGVNYVNKVTFSYTHDAATYGDALSFIAWQRGTGWGGNTQELAVDNVKVIKSGDDTQTNLVANAGFGTDVVEKDPVSRVWDIDTGWHGMYQASTKYVDTTAAVVDSTATINNSNGSLGSAILKGASALKMTYGQGVSGQFGTYGHNYAYTDALALEDGKTYTVSGLYFAGDTGDWATAFGMGRFNEETMKREYAVLDYWLNGTDITNTAYSGYWRMFSFEFTYDAATMGDLSFYAYQRACGYGYANEMAIDNIKVCEKGTTNNLVTNAGFGTDEVVPLAMDSVTLGWNAILVPGAGTPATVSAWQSSIEEQFYDSWLIRSAYTGQNGMKISYDCEKGYDYAAAAGRYFVFSDVLDLENGKTYTIKFNAVGTSFENGFLLGIGNVDTLKDTVDGFATYNLSAGGTADYGLTKEDISIAGYNTSWGKYTYTYTHDASKYPNPRVGFCARSKGNYTAELPMLVAIDDVEVYESGSTVNLLNSGTFETLGAEAPYLTLNGEATAYLEAGAVANANVTNASDEAIGATIILAYFTMDEEYTEQLVKVDYFEDTIDARSIKTVKIEADLTGAEDALYAYAYIWDGLGTLKPLAASNIFEIIQ